VRPGKYDRKRQILTKGVGLQYEWETRSKLPARNGPFIFCTRRELLACIDALDRLNAMRFRHRLSSLNFCAQALKKCFRECPARDLRYTPAAKATDDFRDHTNPSRRSNGFRGRPARIGCVINARPAAIKLRIGFPCLQ
jgi:hypothetical protein